LINAACVYAAFVVKFNPNLNHRQSIRLPEFDYRTVGAYFVTICTFERECFLGDPAVAEIVRQSWRSATHRAPESCDFVVMPNHVHGIVWLRRTTVGAQRPGILKLTVDGMGSGSANISESEGATPLQRAARRILVGSLGAIVRAFKAHSARRISVLRNLPGRPVWQRSYYERVVRDDEELQRVRRYILDNPAKWQTDPNNPAIMRTA
jgi:putative transposase